MATAEHDKDIAKAPYQGPGPFVTAAGEGAIAHYGVALIGLISGAAATFIFHGKATSVVGNIRQWASRQSMLVETGIPSALKRSVANATSVVFGHGKTSTIEEARHAISHLGEKERIFLNDHLTTHEQGFGNWFLMHTIGFIPPVKRWLRTLDDRQTMAFTVGGIAGFAGFLLSPIYYGFTGAKHANAGKRQFEEAKEEILTGRAELKALREKYVSTRMELDEVKTALKARDGGLRVADDATPRMDPTAEATPAALSRVTEEAPDSTWGAKLQAEKLAAEQQPPEAARG